MPYKDQTAQKAYWRSYQQKWCERTREALVRSLGGECAHCGSREHLEFDHINPDTRTWQTQDAGLKGCLCHYIREAEQGLLQLLCRHCNARKSNRHEDQQAELALTDQPF